jgi:hypothetical protein
MVRPFKKENFNLDSNPTMKIYFRQRGDNTYRLLTPDEFVKIKEAFKTNDREAVLSRN